MVHSDYDFVEELFFQYAVDIRTWISRIGTKSFTIAHEAWQNGRLGVKGSVVIVCYDFVKKETLPIPDDKRKALAQHFIAEPARAAPAR
jgi:acyl-CoA thioester hydrolase